MPFSPGFNLAEALDLVALSAIVEGGEAPPQPTGWTIIFDSPVIGQFTEKWQLWPLLALTLSSYAAPSWMLAVSLRTSFHFLYQRVTG
jgi:hypothetical protein